MKSKILLFAAFLAAPISCLFAQSGNVGIGTTTPATKLDVNGAITNREGSDIVVSGTTVGIPALAFSQYRLTGTPTGSFTITGPTTSNGSLALVAGARMILVNTTAQTGTLNSFPVLAGKAQEFAYTNGSWVATNGGPDYDWMKAGNNFPSDPADTVGNIYHIGGRVGIGTNNPSHTLQVVAVADQSTILANNVVAQFDPFGGSDATRPAAITVNGGRAIFGYELEGTTNKYAFLRGNQSTDIRLQVMDANSVIDSNALFIQGATSGFGNVGINTDVPQGRLDVRGTLKVLPDTITQTGNIWNGTSNLNGFEATANITTGDAWIGVQRAGNGAALHVTKPAGATSGQQLVLFTVGGTGVGTISYTGSGVQYNTTSDSRLKENVHSTKYGLATVNAIKVYDYNFKAAREKTVSTGLMAQELYKLYPQAVSVGGGNPGTDPWQVDYSKLTPMLIKAVQELSSKIENLEKENAGLKAREVAVAQLAAEMKELKQMLGVKETNKGSETVSSDK